MAEQQQPGEEALDVTVGDIQLDDAETPDAPAEPTVEDQLAAANDRVLRLQAEVQNQISRAARQLQEERQYATLPLARDLLPVLDNIDRAIESAEKEGPGSGSGGGLLEGIKLVRQQLSAILSQHKCQPIEAAGAAFNPDFHEAILQQPSDEVDAGCVLQDVQTGYKMHDRVVRASQVIVSSGPAPAGDA